MKNKIITLLICSSLISVSAFSQDSTHKSMASKRTSTAKVRSKAIAHKSTASAVKPVKKPMYRNTRLGSSEKKYNTYKKNKYGAGAVTTSPK